MQSPPAKLSAKLPTLKLLTMKGADAEDRALKELLAGGHTLLGRNYRIPGGEIDLITQQGNVVVFTEVRQRASARFGSASESVTPRKLALMRRAAQTYLYRELGRDDVECRLQVISIEGPAQTGTLRCILVEFE